MSTEETNLKMPAPDAAMQEALKLAFKALSAAAGHAAPRPPVSRRASAEGEAMSVDRHHIAVSATHIAYLTIQNKNMNISLPPSPFSPHSRVEADAVPTEARVKRLREA